MAKLDSEALNKYEELLTTYEKTISNISGLSSTSLDGQILAQELAKAAVGQNYSLDDVSRAGVKAINDNYAVLSAEDATDE
jgi:hypothetical protein